MVQTLLDYIMTENKRLKVSMEHNYVDIGYINLF